MRTHLAVADALRRLEQAGRDFGAGDVFILLAHALDIAKDRLTIERPNDLSPAQVARFFDLVKRRAAGEPVSHILGRRAFYGRDYLVTPDVLDPRQETEELIAAALEKPWGNVLDLGTGSGCILVSVLAERPAAMGLGVDLSTKALAVAAENAAAQGVAERCELIESDWYAHVEGPFDLIVSNPPYIAADEMAGLSAEVMHEPRMALTDEGDGLSCYRVITGGAMAHLNAGGWLMVEIGPTQGVAVSAMFEAEGFTQVGIRPDLDGRHRVVLGQKPQ